MGRPLVAAADAAPRARPRRSLRGAAGSGVISVVVTLTNQGEKRYETHYRKPADRKRVPWRVPFGRTGGAGRGRVGAVLDGGSRQRHPGHKKCVQRQAEDPELRR